MKTEIDFLFTENETSWKNSPESGVVGDSSPPKLSSSSPSTTISGFIDETEPPVPEVLATTFSCNGTSELPRHIQDVRERVKV